MPRTISVSSTCTPNCTHQPPLLPLLPSTLAHTHTHTHTTPITLHPFSQPLLPSIDPRARSYHVGLMFHSHVLRLLIVLNLGIIIYWGFGVKSLFVLATVLSNNLPPGRISKAFPDCSSTSEKYYWVVHRHGAGAYSPILNLPAFSSMEM